MRVAWLQRGVSLAVGMALCALLAAGAGVFPLWLPALGVLAWPGLLALEMMWAAAVSSGPSLPFHRWVLAWWEEFLCSLRVFAWWQPWRLHQWADALPREDGRRSRSTAHGPRGVLLVHGYACNRGFWNGWMPHLRAAGVPYVAVSLPNPFAAIDGQIHALEAGWQALEQATGQAPLLVGHSMGGLVIRAWCARHPERAARVPRIVTLGTPHHGTALARWGLGPAARAMRRQSAWLATLVAQESAQASVRPSVHPSGQAPAGLRARTVCYWSPCDNIVFPAQTATLPGADNRQTAPMGHVALVDDASILAAVCGWAMSPEGALHGAR